ncbi:MAG: tetratricopeptide repeat protein, partial [Balneolaceae bacterium]
TPYNSMNISFSLKFIAILFTGILFMVPVQAQNNDFREANQLMQQQNYEEALPILQYLHEQNPEAGIFFDRLMDCMINLKMFDEAIQIAREKMKIEDTTSHTNIRIAEIYHLKGEKERAYELWKEVVADSQGNIQLYYNVGNAMINRREYDMAADLYESARDQFNDNSLFTNELANAKLQAGNFEGAVNEFIRLIRNNPDQMNFVQQRMLRMRDNHLYEIAALELEDHLMDMGTDHAAYRQLHQLLTWLLIETEQYRRAFIAARQYESSTNIMNFSLYSIGNQLLSNNEFEMAAEAYEFYAERGSSSVRYQAMEQQALVYQRWAGYLSDYSLEDYERQQELYRKAYELNAYLLDEASNYAHRSRILVRQTEITLDVLYDIEKAEKWVQILEEELENNSQNLAELYYLQGRIQLFEKSYPRARQLLTRANRNAEDSNLAEKARYFLSLTDFFAGDFEYAQIQLKSLERRNVSYYANNALKLRMWIQDGSRNDTARTSLNSFSKMLEELYHGNFDQALGHYQSIYEAPSHPLKDDALVELAAHAPARHIPYAYSLIVRHRETNQHSPLKERLMWETAKMTRLIVNSGGFTGWISDYEIFEGDQKWASGTLKSVDINWPESIRDIEEAYENLLLEFPQGFYAPYTREALQSISDLSS